MSQHWTITEIRVAKLLNHKGVYTVIISAENENKEIQDLYPDPNWTFNAWSDTGKSKLPTHFASPDGKASIQLASDSEAFADMFRLVSSLAFD
jgi:hypothetical protein